MIDTNIWISASLSMEGAPARVVRRVLDRGLAVFSNATFAELADRLWKPKFDRYLSVELRRRILHDINASAYWTEIGEDIARVSHSRDRDDDKFVHAALAARATWLVTGDRDLLAIPEIEGLTIMTAVDALALPGFPC